MGSHKFFENRECKYYPCHWEMNDINCLFCFCTLYLTDCEGDYEVVEGRKDCSRCEFPHKRENYGIIIDKFKKRKDG